MASPVNYDRLAATCLLAVTCFGLFGATFGCAKPMPNAPSSAPPPLSYATPDEPAFDVPEQGTVKDDEESFNHFSWRDFVALNWPAADDKHKRGQPHSTKTFGDLSAPQVVWESWKSLGELYPDDPCKTPPTEWDSYKATLSFRWVDRERKQQRYQPDGLAGEDAGRIKLLQQSARLADMNQALFADAKVGPLVTQRRTYVRFETRVNRVAYDFMTKKEHRYYIKANLPPILEFLDQTIHVKAAWMELPDDPAIRKRFYHVTAKVLYNWENGEPVSKDQVVGLVGLHIVHKTPKRKDWIWSTFEHVDNLLTEHGPGTPPASFSSKDPPATSGVNVRPPVLEDEQPFPKVKERTPVEVARINTISTTTDKVNRHYQNHPEIKGTVWANYKLVGTQWPRLGLPTRPSPENDQNRLPKLLANITMETYVQESFSCLSCHAGAKPGEFVFYAQVRAYVSPEPGGDCKKPAP